MAELGNLFGGSTAAASDFKVEVEMLDYSYVNECTDWKQLNMIVDVLKSGKEGYYPDLIRVAEEKLVTLLPAKEKRRYESLNHKTTPSEIAEAESELSSWSRSVASKDEQLLHAQQQSVRASAEKALPPVRGSCTTSSSKPVAAATYDAVEESSYVQTANADILALLSASQGKKFLRQSAELGVAGLGEVKRAHRAELEKVKGNESFRVADNVDAVACYSRSLAYNPRSAVVWANRAMAYIRQELFDLAEADSSVALLLDPAYVKAYSRRGLVRFKRGKYAEAVRDFQEALALEPGNAELSKLLQTARDKYLEVEGVSVEEAATGGRASAAAGAVGGRAEADVAAQMLEVAVETVNSVTSLLMPTAGSFELVGSGELRLLVTPATSSGFVRISVVSDDEGESDAEEGEEEEDAVVAANGSAGGVYSRVAIVEDSESDEEEEEAADVQSADARKVASADELKDRGNALLKANEVRDAVQAYTDSLAIDPKFVPALNNRAQAYLVLKEYDAAAADCDAVLALDTGNLKALFRRASALFFRGADRPVDRAQATADLKQVLAADPGNALASKLLQEIQKATPIAAPTSVPVAVPGAAPAVLDVQKLKQRAQQLLGDGLNDKVVALLGQYLRGVDEPPFCELLESDRTSLLHLLATAYASTADFEHAVAVQEAIIRLDPTNFRALFKRAEAQLQIAAKASAETRGSALELAEQDIAAALHCQGDSKEVLALRQKLLRMRNTAPEPVPAQSPKKDAAAAAVAAPSSSSSSSRQQSDMQKELGNQAMAEKQHVNAVMFYSNAIKLDDTNLAAFNNRALAHMKQSAFALAEADATAVVDGTAGASIASGVQDGSHTLRLKALCRRAQARRGLGEALMNMTGTADLGGAERKYKEAVADLQELLKSDSSNKTALAELKQLKDLLKRCEDMRVSNVSAGSFLPSPLPARSKDTPTKVSASSATASPAQPPAPPRADMQRVSAMLGPGGGSPSAFGDLGLVARSSKKLGSGAAAATSPSPAKTPVVESAATPPVTSKKAGVGTPSLSPPPSVALTAAPSEPPKTVYEFERVWRGLKSRPDLFAQYVACFKKSTYKKVLKEALSPDLVSFMWRSLQEHSPGPQAQLRALAGFSSAPSFCLTLSLLPAEDLRCIAGILDQLSARAAGSSGEVTAGAVEELRALYGL